jgi:hypothetical protein
MNSTVAGLGFSRNSFLLIAIDLWEGPVFCVPSFPPVRMTVLKSELPKSTRFPFQQKSPTNKKARPTKKPDHRGAGLHVRDDLTVNSVSY